jgi:hypothetical protein
MQQKMIDPFGLLSGDKTDNNFTDDYLNAVELSKVVSVVPDPINNWLVVTYTDGTVSNLNLDDIVTDIYVDGASLDAITNVLTLTSSTGGADVVVNLSDFINSSEFITGQALKVDKVVGKQLSTEDYTTAEKVKLASLLTSTADNDHNLLINKDLADQHPQSSITGLIPDLGTKEDKLNKVVSWSGVLSDTLYPSEKLVKEYVDLNKGSSTYTYTEDYSAAIVGDTRIGEFGNIYILTEDEIGTTGWFELSGLSTTSKLVEPITITSTSTLSDSFDVFLIDATSGSISITLPNVENKVLNVYRDDTSSNTVTFLDSISGSVGFELSGDENLTVVKINSKWRLL